MSTISITRPQKPEIQAEKPSRKRRMRALKYLPLYLFIAPFYILFVVFKLFPILFSLFLSFQKWDGIGPMQFIGLNNFTYLLTDTHFWQAVGNTLIIWLMSTIPTLFLALVIAFLLNASIRLKFVYQIAFFLPHVTSIVAITIIFSSLFGNQFGLLNALLVVLGGNKIEWLNSPLGIQVAIASMIIWRGVGYTAIIYLAGLQSIPVVLYEAAQIDGARASQIFFHITIPLLRPVILFTVITSTIAGLQVFTEPQVLVGGSGGTGAGGLTMVLYLYQQAFTQYRFGYGATVGWGMFVIIVVFSLINWRIVQRTGTHA
jgi:cellobiose transport system permease protein